MIDSVKVTKKARRTEQTPQEYISEAPGLDLELILGSEKRDARDDGREGITEKRLLHRRNIARHPYEKRHKCKAQSSYKNACYTFGIVIL